MSADALQAFCILIKGEEELSQIRTVQVQVYSRESSNPGHQREEQLKQKEGQRSTQLLQTEHVSCISASLSY